MDLRFFFSALFFTIVAVFFVFAVILSPNFGLTDSEGDYLERPMDQYIIDNTQSETGADNGVTAVVFDYRGFDTLGEATVLFTAVAGVIIIFRRLKK